MNSPISGVAKLVALTSLFCITTEGVNADETASVSADTNAAKSVLRAVPIRNHWDANAWDPSGGSLFWHDTRDRRAKAESGRNARHAEQRAEKSNRRGTSSRS